MSTTQVIYPVGIDHSAIGVPGAMTPAQQLSQGALIEIDAPAADVKAPTDVTTLL